MSLTRASAAVIKTEEIVNNRNRIINGAMEIDQRNAGAAVTATTSGSYFGADRFRIGIGATNAFSLSIQQVADAPANSGFLYSQKYTVNTATTFAAGDTFQTGQRVEYSNMHDFGWNDATARYYVTTYTINSANTWEYKTVTVASPISGGKTATLSFWVKSSLTGDFAVMFNTSGSPAQNGTGVYALFDLGQGSNFQTSSLNTWTTSVVISTTTSVRLLANAGATWQVTGVQLEVGSVATPFERRPYGMELALCQRYFEVIGNDAASFYQRSAGSAGANFVATYPFCVQKRAQPTMTKFGTWNVANSSSQPTVNPAGKNVYYISLAATSNADTYWYASDSTQYITASAEL